jgi:hypothetical protein
MYSIYILRFAFDTTEHFLSLSLSLSIVCDGGLLYLFGLYGTTLF